MNAGTRIIIAAISLVCAAGFFLTALDPNGLDPYVFSGLAVFSLVVAIASLSSRSHPMTLRVMGTMLCCGYITQFPNLINTYHPLQTSVGLFLWGVPAGYLAITGQFPHKRN